MLLGLLGIFVCLLLGEVFVSFLMLPIPGSVIGMLLLLFALMVNGGVPEGVRSASQGLLKYLPLILIPAGVGLIVHLELIANHWLAIFSALVISTVITFILSAVLVMKLSKSENSK